MGKFTRRLSVSINQFFILHFSNRSLSVAAVVVSITSLVASGLYVAASAPDSINGCVNKKTKNLRISANCRDNEYAISWDKTGPQGDPGIAGLPGEKGEQGLVGPAGANGNQSVVVQNRIYKVYDANNTYVGDLLGDTGGVFYVLRNNVRLGYRVAVGDIIQNAGDLLFLTSDCTGDIYASPMQGYSAQYPYVIASTNMPSPPTTPYVIRYPSSESYLSGVNFYTWDSDSDVCRPGTPGGGFLQKMDVALTGIPYQFEFPLTLRQG